MRKISTVSILLTTAFFQGANAEIVERMVMIKVIDEESREPVSGAIISADFFWFDEIGSIPLHHDDVAVTDTKGVGAIKIDFDRSEATSSVRSASFNVIIDNDLYKALTSTSLSIKKKIVDRDPERIPDHPDRVVGIRSLVTEERLTEEHKIRNSDLNEAAERLLENSPSYWPEQKEGAYNGVADKVGGRLVSKRWELARKSGIQNSIEEEEIKKIVIKHMRHSSSKVSEIAFLDTNTAMVNSSWQYSPLAGAGYTYVLSKIKGTWTIIRNYLEWVS